MKIELWNMKSKWWYTSIGTDAYPTLTVHFVQLGNKSIMGEIYKLIKIMMPDTCGSNQAELYKLNNYSGPNGHL